MRKIFFPNLLIAVILFAGLHSPLHAQNIIWLDSSFDSPRLVKTGADGAELFSQPLTVGSLPQSIAVNTNDNALFWTSLAFVNADINSITADFSSTSVVLDSQSVLRGIAIDPVNGHIYWTATNLVSGPKIARADLNGENAKILLDFGPGSSTTPRALSLDIGGEKMYWTNFGEGKIQRSDMAEGSSPEDVLTGLSGPAGLAIDTVAKRIFWAEMNRHQIKSADLDGGNDSLLVAGLSYPNYLSIYPAKNRMAWTEMGSGKIKSANLDGSEIFDYGVTAIAPTGVIIEPSPISSVSGNENVQIPQSFSLQQNYPNPFNPVTTIRYELPEKAFVNLSIYDMLGRKIKTLLDGQKSAGTHTVKFAAETLASGMYFYKIETNKGFNAVKKMVLLR
ncbi:MAG: T9SS C-terminal target domain-containing protein [Calditrichaeota bacterium]|nr:MAG: T9SS C-terminal target domain-containing protein [Calditrichota bacterium]